jgi:hypothetical protein
MKKPAAVCAAVFIARSAVAAQNARVNICISFR